MTTASNPSREDCLCQTNSPSPPPRAGAPPRRRGGGPPRFLRPDLLQRDLHELPDTDVLHPVDPEVGERRVDRLPLRVEDPPLQRDVDFRLHAFPPFLANTRSMVPSMFFR